MLICLTTSIPVLDMGPAGHHRRPEVALRLALMLLLVTGGAVAGQTLDEATVVQVAVEAEMARIQADADARMREARDAAAKKLDALVEATTKTGDLDGALAIRKMAEEVRAGKAYAKGATDILGRPIDAPGTIPRAHAQHLLQAIESGQLTEADWKRTGSSIWTVQATAPLATGIDLKADEMVILVPNPEDRWTAKDGVWPRVTYLGDLKVKAEWRMSLRHRVDTTTPGPVLSGFAVKGPGRIVLLPGDLNLKDNSGQIRVKVVRVR